MKISKIVVGRLMCNCYIIEKDGHVLIIDPGDDGDKIINEIGNRIVDGVVITHYHTDHYMALNELEKKYNVKVMDDSNMKEGINNVGKFTFYKIDTKGHKEDAITLYFKYEKVMFVGDFIFRDSIGRCDLPGGDIIEMNKSIEKIKKYDRDIIIYPGHGESTILGYEIDNNCYFC